LGNYFGGAGGGVMPPAGFFSRLGARSMWLALSQARRVFHRSGSCTDKVRGAGLFS